MSAIDQYQRHEFDVTVRQILTRDTKTDEEHIMWQVESEYLNHVYRGDTPEAALSDLADNLESDDGLSVDELLGE